MVIKKFAQEIEENMAFFMSRDLKKSLGANEAVAHLVKAHALLQNAGLKSHCNMISSIIKRAKEIDESIIEVQV